MVRNTNRWEQHTITHCRLKHSDYISRLIGRLKVKVAPLPSELFSAHILPPCASTIFLEINNPRPVPWNDFDANFENNLGTIWWCIPWPVSFMVTKTYPLSLISALTNIFPSSVSERTYTIAQLSDQLMGLSTRIQEIEGRQQLTWNIFSGKSAYYINK